MKHELESELQRGRVVVSLLVLTMVTGVVDAVSYLGLGRVLAGNMTGNVLFLAFAFAGASGLSAERPLFSLVGFLAGAMAGGRIHAALSAGGRRRWIRTAVLLEAALLFGAAFTSMGVSVGPDPERLRVLTVIVFLASAMGLRNATIGQLNLRDLTTTVLTTTLAALAADSSVAGRDNFRIGRRVASVICMFGGAVAGTLLLRFGLTLPLALSGTAVLATGWSMAASMKD